MPSPSKVSDGPRNATTDDRGIRTYEWRGVKYPSVTSLRRLTGMPFPLANWQMEQVITAAVEHSSVIDSMIAMEGKEAASKWLRKEAMGARDSAANRGTAVHAAASMKVPVALAEPEVAGPLAMFYHFLEWTGATELLSEKQVFNLHLGYGGSLDALYQFPQSCPHAALRGRRIVTDLKTGKGLYLDHALQLIGYAMGEFVGQDDVVDDEATRLLHSAHGLGLLHLTDTSWEFVEIGVTKSLFSKFRAMCEFAHWQQDTSLDSIITGRFAKP